MEQFKAIRTDIHLKVGSLGINDLKQHLEEYIRNNIDQQLGKGLGLMAPEDRNEDFAMENELEEAAAWLNQLEKDNAMGEAEKQTESKAPSFPTLAAAYPALAAAQKIAQQKSRRSP